MLERFLWRLVMATLAAAMLVPATTAAELGRPPRLIVKFKDTAGKLTRDSVDLVAALATTAGTPLRYERALLAGAHLVTTPALRSSADADAVVARLTQHPAVEYVERSRVWKAERVPNDTYFPNQFFLSNATNAIDAVSAWDITTGSPRVVVAIIDSGYRPHADLAQRILPGYDFVNAIDAANDGDGRDFDPSDPGDWIDAADKAGLFAGRDCDVQPSSWHGTAVTGAIGANGNNESWTTGVDWSAGLSPLRALGKCGGDDFDIAEALAWAGGLEVTDVPANPYLAQVVNMSLGSDGACPKYFQNVVNLVLAKGITRAIVASAGNAHTADPHSPSDCVGVIAVGATAASGARAAYSNFGARVDISAPGGDAGIGSAFKFLTLYNRGVTVPGTDTVATLVGTSFAAPLVSGVAALMLSLAPQLTATQIRDFIKATAQPFPATSDCTPATCGAGILNAAGAVRVAQALAAPPANVLVVEFYHAALDHYFITWVPAEIAVLDAGTLIKGWTRTGQAFQAFSNLVSGTAAVCRIYIPPGKGDGHYFGRDQAECIGTMTKNPAFINEESAFLYLYPSLAGTCAPATQPVYRVYSNRPDANHRYTTDRPTRDLMVTRGWLAEGDGADTVVMCAPG